MIGLTHEQAQALQFIRSYMAASEGVAPSFVEIKRAIGASSSSTVSRLLNGLEERGHIRRQYQRRRGIELVTPEPDTLRRVSDTALLAEVKRRGLA